MNDLIISKQRVKNFGEVFTPPEIVKQMVDTVENCCAVQAKVFEPSCGTGNFLIEILQRKLAAILANDQEPYFTHIDCYLALASLYGIDIQQDNIEMCRRRLKEVFINILNALSEQRVLDKLIDRILEVNIKQGNTLTDLVAFLDMQHNDNNNQFVLRYIAMDLKTGHSQHFLTEVQSNGWIN